MKVVKIKDVNGNEIEVTAFEIREGLAKVLGLVEFNNTNLWVDDEMNEYTMTKFGFKKKGIGSCCKT